MRSYIKRINKILHKQARLRLVGDLQDYDKFLEWQDKEIIAPLVRLGPKAIKDMLTIFRTAVYNQRTVLIRVLWSMGDKFVDDKANVIVALTDLLHDTSLNLEGEMKRQIYLSLESLKR